jgi:hypothetical protein
MRFARARILLTGVRVFRGLSLRIASVLVLVRNRGSRRERLRRAIATIPRSAPRDRGILLASRSHLRVSTCSKISREILR